MRLGKGTKKALCGEFLLVIAVLASACAGVSQADYDAVKQQLAAKEQEAATAKQQLQSAQAAGQQEVTTVRAQVAAKEKEVADLQKSLGQLQGEKPVIWTKVLPTPTPRPTATPRPPGFVAPPAAVPPPELVNEVVPFTFYIEHLTGHQVTSIAQYPGCVPNSQFRRGAHLVWRFEVFDTSTGKRLTGLDKDVTIKVVLPNGEEKLSRYSKRGGIGPWMWVATYTIPTNYPLGTFDYKIVVTKGSRTGVFDQNKVALIRPATATAAGTDSRIQIVE